jgi:DNA-binding LacI/PurR family transcriptional regulator
MKTVPTLQDVADAAGVSRTTASRALRETPHPDVGEATRQRIRAVAEDLGYRPSSVAFALRTGSTWTISLFTDPASWPWVGSAIVGAAEAADQAGRRLRVDLWDPARQIGAQIAESVARNRDAGVIVLNMSAAPELDAALAVLEVPAVAIDDVNNFEACPAVTAANRRGGQLAGEHLIRSGRRRIAVICPPNGPWYAHERLAGLRDAHRQAGVELDESLIAVSDEDFDHPSGFSPAIDQLIEAGARFDGVFALCDYLAATALKSLARAGLRVPQDVAVVGFDDERAARLVSPALTTIRQDFRAAGRIAAGLLTGPEPAPAGVREVPVELVVRESAPA